MKKKIDPKKFVKEIQELCSYNNIEFETKANNLIYDLNLLIEDKKMQTIRDIASLFTEEYSKICSSCHISLLSIVCNVPELKDLSKKYFDKIYKSLEALYGELGASKLLIGIEL